MLDSKRPTGIPLRFALSVLIATACGGESGDGATVTAAGDARAGAGSTTGGEEFPSAADDPVFVGEACASSVAAATFSAALCSCEDANIAGYLKTRSRRSSAADPGAEQPGGDVGVNRDYVTAGYADVGGSFAVAGERDARFGGFLNVGQDLRFAPALDVAGLVEVGRDAYLADGLRAIGRVKIGGDLHAPAGSGARGIALVDVGGERLSEPVSVDAPCACAPEQIIDVATLVEAAESDNDNASIGLDPQVLNAVIGTGTVLTLPTGRFYIEQLGGAGNLRIHATGKAALFVADDLLATGLFRVELDPDAELDLFVRDNLIVTGAARFGDFDRPAATRVYVGGSGDIAIAGASAFVGNLYAPTANVLLGGYGHVDGSLFAKNVTAAGFLELAYDSAITEPGDDCPPLAEGDLPRIR